MLDSLLNFEKNPAPDIVVIGVQELVKLNAKNVVITNNEQITKIWETAIK